MSDMLDRRKDLGETKLASKQQMVPSIYSYLHTHVFDFFALEVYTQINTEKCKY